ncbi:MAG: hypothetical protein JNK12_12500 [Acidimicrobiales bacterium]|nr:hypothetical protein [Acidimicrobiales bacterium]
MPDRTFTGPPVEELPSLSAALVEEVDRLLSSPRWRLLMHSSTVSHHIHAAASLRHVAVLLTDVADAVEAHREIAVRVLGRAHIEAWLIGMYVVVYGDDAIADIEAGYVRAISAQHKRLAEHDERRRAELADAKRRNKAIRSQNRNRRRWNDAHPDDVPKPFTEEVPLPSRPSMDIDLHSALADGAPDLGDPPPLALAGVAARLAEHARTEEGPDAVLDVVYDLGYRGLSSLGAHPTLWVLNAYLDFKPTGAMVGTIATINARSMADAILDSAVHMTAVLTLKVIGLRADDAPVAQSIVARYAYETVDGTSAP